MKSGCFLAVAGRFRFPIPDLLPYEAEWNGNMTSADGSPEPRTIPTRTVYPSLPYAGSFAPGVWQECFPVREYHQYLPTCNFIKDQAAASQLAASAGIPYTDALHQVNYQTQQQHQAEEEAKKQQLARQASQQLLLDEMNKYAKAKLGEVPRSEMPQVCACDAEESDDIPTGKLEFVSPDKLKKTQEKINKTKARGIAGDWANAGKEPVLISRDNWILDGHHRVEAAKTLGKLVRVVRVDLPGRKALTKLQELEEEIDA